MSSFEWKINYFNEHIFVRLNKQYSKIRELWILGEINNLNNYARSGTI